MLAETVLAAEKENLKALSAALSKEDIRELTGFLSEKNDELRYKALVLLQHRSAETPDVYPYWEEFQKRLSDGNSYQRSIGALLIAENAKWDAENRLDGCVDEYFKLFQDEKPITARQAIQALGKIIPWKPALRGRIAEALMKIDLSAVKETMRKSLLLDIVGALTAMRKYGGLPEADAYIANALTGGILDKKSIKLLQNI